MVSEEESGIPVEVGGKMEGSIPRTSTAFAFVEAGLKPTERRALVRISSNTSIGTPTDGRTFSNVLPDLNKNKHRRNPTDSSLS